MELQTAKIKVESDSQPGIYYTMTCGDLDPADAQRLGIRRGWACTCPDFVNRGAQRGSCKHIRAVTEGRVRNLIPVPAFRQVEMA